MVAIPHYCRRCGGRLIAVDVVLVQPLETLQLIPSAPGEPARWVTRPGVQPATPEYRCSHCQTPLPAQWVRWLEESFRAETPAPTPALTGRVLAIPAVAAPGEPCGPDR